MPARRLPPVLIALVLAAACSGTEQSGPTGTEAATTTVAVLADRTLEMTTDDGQVSLSLDGKLPPGWPPEFPLPPGTTPAGSGSLIRNDSGGMVGVFRITGAAPDAFAFYQSNPDVTVSDPSSVGLGQAYVGRAKLTGTWTGSVTVGGVGSSDLLVVVLRGQPATTGTTAGTTITSTAPPASG